MKKTLFLLVLCLLPSFAFADWKMVEPGIDYRREGEPTVHFFRIDPARYRLDLLLASDYKVAALTMENYRTKSGALFVINGGFFDESFRSLGLLHRNGQTINPVREVSWGIFLIDAKGPRIIQRKDWLPSRAVASAVLREAAWKSDGVKTAIQVGPRLVVDGKVQTFKEAEPSRRSAIGITPEGLIEIVLSENLLTLKEWAETLQKDCPNALNLDGGGSSQLSAAFSGLSLKIDGMTTVPNAVAVFKK